jgi:4-amino-4-deoxy-L-arabinose transferase-like glycosyltransferase
MVSHFSQPQWLARSVLVAGLAVVLVLLWSAPGDMHRIDQPRTASYTADMVAHGRWFLPRDVTGAPSTKPPLVNWVTAPLLLLGWHDQGAFWLPVTVANLLGIALLAWWAARLFSQGDDAAQAPVLGALAAMLTLASPYSVSLPVYVRPDGLLVPLLTASWVVTTLLLDRLHRQSQEPGTPYPTGLAVGFWVAVGLLGLTKFVPALYPILYAVLASRFHYRSPELWKRIGWAWGLPLALGLFAVWLVPAYWADPLYFRKGLIGVETLGRFTGLQGIYGARHHTSSGPWDLLLGVWKIPAWTLERFAPLSLLALVAVARRRLWCCEDARLTPAFLWMTLILLLPLASAGKTAQYLLPAISPMAVLAAAEAAPWLRRQRAKAWASAAAVGGAALMAIGFAVWFHWFCYAGKNPTATHLRTFARESSRIVGTEPVVYVETGYTTLQALMGRNQAGRADAAQWARAKWVIAPVPLLPGVMPRLASGTITPEHDRRPSVVFGLFPIDAVQGTALVSSDP